MAKTWKRPVAALLLCALLAGAGSLAAAPYAGESGELTPQERARRANVPEGPWIWIDIPQKSLTLYEGTEVKKRYAVATGTGDTPSPIGTFRVTSRFAGDLGGFGTRFLGLNVPWGQFGIHGTYVRDSEELYGLVPNGAKVVIQGGPYGQLDSYLRYLIPGDRNSHVAAVQRRLTVLGYYTGQADGIYGRGTQAAVTRARKDLGLPALDAVDEAFYRAIGLILFE